MPTGTQRLVLSVVASVALGAGCVRAGVWSSPRDAERERPDGPIADARPRVEREGADAGSWWSSTWAYRRPITVTNSSAVSAVIEGYSVKLSLDHAALVAAGKSRASGEDVRVVWKRGDGSIAELDRVNETPFNSAGASTELWFRLAGGIPPGGADGSYSLYYGNAQAGSPPARRDSVYLLWDDFDTGDPRSRWQTNGLGAWAAGTPAVSPPSSLTATADTLDTGTLSALPALSVKNAELEVMLRSEDVTPDLAVMLRCAPGKALDGYDANAGSPGPAWHVAKYVADSWKPLGSAGTPVSGVWYRVAFTLFEQQARLVVDGHQIVPATGWLNVGADHTGPGNVCLRCNQAPCFFDNLKLRHFVEPEPQAKVGSEEKRSP